MSFHDPARLWLLALLPALAAAYLLMRRARRTATARFTGLHLLDTIAPQRPPRRRHITAALHLTALAAVLIAFAGPAAATRTPRDRAVIIVAIDVSLSMRATDVAPSRIDAATTEARDFIAHLPATVNVGLIAFAGGADLLAPPSTDHTTALQALGRLTLDTRTAVGDAVLTGLTAIRTAAARLGGHPPAHIVLMSDGGNTTGHPVADAVTAARAAGVPVSTIAFGTPYGTITLDGHPTPVQVDTQTLRDLADGTHGTAYTAQTAGQLAGVYRTLGHSLAWTTTRRDITADVAGLAALLTLATAAASIAWSPRLP